jgi:hypothetical protein
VRGCTFDDFLLTPQLGVVPSRDPGVIEQLVTTCKVKQAEAPVLVDQLWRSQLALRAQGEVSGES